MRAGHIFVVLLMIDLFLFYGATAIGETPYEGNHTFTKFVTNVNGTLEPNNASADLVTTDFSPVDMVANAVSGLILNVLNPIIDFLNWLLTLVSMPFVIGDMMHLTGMAKVIPGAIFSAMLLFAAAKALSGRDI